MDVRLAPYRIVNKCSLALAPSPSPLSSRARYFKNYRNFTQPSSADSHVGENGSRNGKHARKNGSDSDREFFLSLLSTTTTRRDAKSYLSRFKGAYPKALSLSLVRIRAIDHISDSILDGLASTLLQLSRLGITPVIVVEGEAESASNEASSNIAFNRLTQQADRLLERLQKDDSVRVSRLDEVFSLSETCPSNSAGSVPLQGQVEVQYPGLLRKFLLAGKIPVISSFAYTSRTQKREQVSSGDVLLALAREFSGWRLQQADSSQGSHNTGFLLDRPPDASEQFKLERIILIDPLGGIPMQTPPPRAHIFINLEQEYDDIDHQLSKRQNLAHTPLRLPTTDVSAENQENPLTVEAAEESSLLRDPRDEGGSSAQRGGHSMNYSGEAAREYKNNLELVRHCLSLLPPSASAIITSPEEAATVNNQDQSAFDLGVQTRRPKNPLIFNLLTDKPIFSSSLPTIRRSDPNLDTRSGNLAMTTPLGPTLVRRGMPLTMIPDPRVQTWVAPHKDDKHMNLQDPKIDFPRLLHLIEDSFGRSLDVEHYLNRIRNKIAGIIVAGEYEGGAILTWELPPGVEDDGSDSSRRRLVPYLDKFAVLRRSQGAGGVADIVFSAMVRSCFPDGVCWRSRKDNPVNKWYFERSLGTWKLPDSNWTMFWTTPGLEEGSRTWKDYESVCRHVQPSWADKGQKAD